MVETQLAIGFAPIPVPGGSATEPSQPATTPQPAPEKKPAPTRIAPTPPKNDSGTYS